MISPREKLVPLIISEQKVKLSTRVFKHFRTEAARIKIKKKKGSEKMQKWKLAGNLKI